MNSLSLKLEEYALEKLFSEARTHNAWQDKAIAPELLQELYDLLKWGRLQPTVHLHVLCLFKVLKPKPS